MTSTTETPNSGVNQTQNASAIQEPVSPVSENQTTAEQQTEQTEQSSAETASPKKEAVPKPSIHKLDFEKDVVYLYQFSRCPTIPSASAFCLKVENWLRMNGIQYEVCLCLHLYLFVGHFQKNIYSMIVLNVK